MYSRGKQRDPWKENRARSTRKNKTYRVDVMGDIYDWRIGNSLCVSFPALFFPGQIQLSLETETEIIRRSIGTTIRRYNNSGIIVADVSRVQEHNKY